VQARARGWAQDPPHRTLTGVGGTGKTRLAIEAARRASKRFPSGVMFAALADVGDAVDLVDALCSATGVTGGDLGGTSFDQRGALLRGLPDRRGLLVVDNCEHLLDPIAELVDEILERSPHLQVLATSREPPDVAGERVIRVTALDDATALDLMTERARAGNASFTLSETERAAAIDLCRRLDGLPLAIELAAARLRAMSVTDVASRLDDRFRLLAGRGRTHDRHATLRATLDWSFDLLDADERVLLSRLSVFAGGFELAAVEEIFAIDPIEANAVLDLLITLVDKSLVVAVDVAGATRYTMLETVRAFAAEQRAARDETEILYERHAAWIVSLANEIWLAAHEEQQARADRLLHEADNARAAHTWAVEGNHVDTALAIAAALARGWILTGGAVEAQRRCEQALTLDGGDSTARLLCMFMASTFSRTCSTPAIRRCSPARPSSPPRSPRRTANPSATWCGKPWTPPVRSASPSMAWPEALLQQPFEPTNQVPPRSSSAGRPTVTSSSRRRPFIDSFGPHSATRSSTASSRKDHASPTSSSSRLP